MGDPHDIGAIGDTVPHTFGSIPADPAWATAYPAVVYELWRRYGDVQAVESHYPNLVLLATYEQGRVNASGIGKMFSNYGA